MKGVILGLGNPILGDDAIGLKVAKALGYRFPQLKVVTQTNLELGLLEEIQGNDICFVVDAVIAAELVGKVIRFKEGDIWRWRHLFSLHGMDLFSLLSLGRHIGYKIPKLLEIYGIGIGETIYISKELTKTLRDKLDEIVYEIAMDIKSHLASLPESKRPRCLPMKSNPKR